MIGEKEAITVEIIENESNNVNGKKIVLHFCFYLCCKKTFYCKL